MGDARSCSRRRRRALFWPSAQRHWTFASGRDLALFYQTQWLMAHGQPLLNTVIGMPPFADHLTLDDFLMAPLLRLHDSAATLLFVQARGRRLGGLSHPGPDRAPRRTAAPRRRAWPRPGCWPPTSTWA